MSRYERWAVGLGASLACVTSFVACHDVSSFSTVSGGVYEGSVVSGSFVRAGVGGSTRMCLTIDTDRLQSAPGSLSTDDGLFNRTPFRTIPQFWQDSLSTLNFGEGRIQNVLYVATANATDAGPAGDVVVIISFMVGGNVEVRLLRGAPAVPDAGPPSGAPTSLYGIFSLSLSPGPSACPF